MTNSIIQTQLDTYAVKSAADEWNALREIAQELCLAALAQSDFFENAAFQGGTCLRIVHQLPRYSEDLDFLAKTASPEFKWDPYLKKLEQEFRNYDLHFDVKDRSSADKAVKSAFLKENSFGKQLNIAFPRSRDVKKISIKLEIDTNPPAHSGYETHFLAFPFAYSVVTQDLPSLFAGKCHALLCRNYLKGRDWFDFIWYVAKKSQVNFQFLSDALNQEGPYKNQNKMVDKAWLIQTLKEKIEMLSFEKAKADAKTFLGPTQFKGLDVWGKDFFLSLTSKMDRYL